MNPDLEEAGSLVSAGLAAGEIDRASVRRSGDAHQVDSCRNCGAELTGRYCRACGQAGHLYSSLLHLTEEVLHGVLHFDAKGWRTLPLLIARPGLLTRRYIDGQRTRYVSPLALFLFTVFLMFFVFSLTSNGSPSTHITAAQRAAVEADLARTIADSNAEVARAATALTEAHRTGEGVTGAETELAAAKSSQRIEEMTVRAVTATLPAAQGAAQTGESTDGSAGSWQAQLAMLHVHTGFASLDTRLRHVLSNPDLFLYRLKNTAYKFSFMLIPISLPFLWLMFIGRGGIAIYDHAVFSLYSLSFMSLLLVTVDLLAAIGAGAVVPFMVLLIPPLHMFVQLRETYQLSVFSALWRTLTLICVAGTAFALFLAFIVMMALH